MVPAFLCSLYLTFYMTDSSLRQTLTAGPKGVRLRESWLYILKSLIASVGGQELFNNHDIAQPNLSKHLPVFYCKIITCWRDLIASNPKSKNNVLEQIVWNNKSITSDKKSIYYPLCGHAGILKIKDLLTHSKNALRRLILFITDSVWDATSDNTLALSTPYLLLNSICQQSSTSQIIMDEITYKKFTLCWHLCSQRLCLLVRKES